MKIKYAPLLMIPASVLLTSCLQLMQPVNSNQAVSTNEVTYADVTPYKGETQKICQLYYKYRAEKNHDYARRELQGLLVELKGKITKIRTDLNNDTFYAVTVINDRGSEIEYWDLFGSSQNWNVGETRVIKGVLTDISAKNVEKNNCLLTMNNIDNGKFEAQALKPGECRIIKGNYKKERTLCMPSHELSPQ